MTDKVAIEWPHAVAGCVAGLATVVALHPLDVIKTRMQVQDGRGSLLPVYKSSWDCFRTIWVREGIHGLYAGLGPCLIASTLSWGLYFFFYNRSKHSWKQNDSSDALSPLQHLLSGIEAGTVATLLTNPIWVLKTRFQLQEARRHIATGTTSIVAQAQYRSLRQAIRTIAREEGVKGFYRGIGPSLFMTINAAIQFAVYEELRQLVTFFTKEHAPSPEMAFVIGGISKATATVMTYPAQVMRSRLQQRFDVGRTLKYTSLRNALFTTFHREGFPGLYKGLLPSILRVVPQSSLLFMVYEKTIAWLKPFSESPPLI